MKKFPSEDEFISHIAQLIPPDRTVSVGIGDDGAVIDIPTSSRLITTTDSLVEGTHFRGLWVDPVYLAKRVVSVNISDCAAMGVAPRYALCSLIIPQDSLHISQAQLFMEALVSELTFHGITLVGGNISRGATLSISLTLLAVVQAQYSMLTRNGAVLRDMVLVTGQLGNASYELSQLESGAQQKAAYISPSRVAFGKLLAERKLASACIDVSDGLVLDLNRLTKASGVGACMYEELIPVAVHANLDHALYGGEDYELLFTAKSELVPQIFETADVTQTPVSIIGKVRQGKSGIELIDRQNRPKKLKPFGWDHLS